MSYIDYLQDWKSLGFSCKKDMESISYFWILIKDKQKIILIRSK